MKIEYQTTFGGYITVLRASLCLIKTKTLSFSQFGAYIALLTQVDFDKRHKTYGVLLRDDKEIAKALECDSTTIYMQRKALIKKGLFIEKDGLTTVPNFFSFELSWSKTLAKIPFEFLQDLFVRPQSSIGKLQEVIEKSQYSSPQNTPQSSKFPYKGNVGLSQQDIDDINDSLKGSEGGV